MGKQRTSRYRSGDDLSNRDGPESASTYIPWLHDLTTFAQPPARILDLGCGAGVPADEWLARVGYTVTGLDISEVQVGRARHLVPGATFILGDMATFDVEAAGDAR